MNPHDLPSGPALVTAVVLSMGLASAPAAAQDAPEPPPQEQTVTPGPTLSESAAADVVQINTAEGTQLTLDTAGQQLVEMLVFVAERDRPSDDDLNASAKALQTTAGIVILDARSFTVPRWWWDGKLAQLEAGGTLTEPVPQPVLVRDPNLDLLERAPTCGACCHGDCGEYLEKFGPLPEEVPEPDQKKKKKKKKKDR